MRLYSSGCWITFRIMLSEEGNEKDDFVIFIRWFIGYLLTSTGIVIFLVMCFAFLCFGFNKIYIVRCCNRLPQIRVRPFFIFFRTVGILHDESRIVSALCLLFQVLCGTVAILRKQKLAFIWVPFRPTVLFYHPKTIEVVVNSSVSIEKSREYKFLHPWLGTGLLTSSGEKWRSRRRLITPAFHFRILEDFVPVFNEQSKLLAIKLTDKADQDWIDLRPLLTLCTLDIICETAMGAQIRSQENADSEYVRAVHEIGYFFYYRIPQPWLWMDWMFYLFPSGKKFLKNLRIVHGFTRNVIKEKIESYSKKQKSAWKNRNANSEENSKKRLSFLELLVKHHLDNESFTVEHIREEVDTFMFEGHDTTAAALTWTLYNIGLHPEVHDIIDQELHEIFNNDQERHVNIDDIRSMKYLECVIKESLRLYPPVPFIGREVEKDMKVMGHTIASGTLCVVFPFMVHRDPDIYENPEVFDPGRFLPENCVGRHPYAYIPFSVGQRNCIGQRFALMEEKIVLANILRKFKIKSLDPPDKIQIKIDIILRSAMPLRMKLIRR